MCRDGGWCPNWRSPREAEAKCDPVHTAIFWPLFKFKLEVRSLVTFEFSSFTKKQEQRRVVEVG